MRVQYSGCTREPVRTETSVPPVMESPEKWPRLVMSYGVQLQLQWMYCVVHFYEMKEALLTLSKSVELYYFQSISKCMTSRRAASVNGRGDGDQ